MRKEEVQLIQGDTIHTITIIIQISEQKQPLQFKKLLSRTLSTTPKTIPKILNLSSYNFSNIQLSVLRHSTSFTGTSSGRLSNYKSDLSNFTKIIQMKEIFNDTKQKKKIMAPNMKINQLHVINPQETGETKSRELSLTLNEIGNLIPNVISYKSNFTMKNILHSCLLKGN